MRFLLCVLVVAILGTARAAEPKRLPTEIAVQAAALVDLKTLAAADQPFTRYLDLRLLDRATGPKLGSLTLNYISRAGAVRRPAVVADGLLLRVDLRLFAPEVGDLEEWIELWEEFSFDPTYSTLITRDTINFVLKAGGELPEVVEVGQRKIRVKTAPYVVDGEEFDTRWVSVVRLPGRHLDPEVTGQLSRLTGSGAPVVEARYFMFRALSTVKDQGVYATVFGGLYYDLAGIKKSGDRKVTDEDLFFEARGVGDTKRGLTAQAVFDRVRSDRKAAMFRSKVTGKPRAVDFLKSLDGKNEAFIFVTHDVGDADVDVGTHPMMNLLKFKDKAREVIYSKRNGMHGFVLFDGNGKLQDEAPPDVVKDHQIPAPHTARLQGAISCIRCHGTDGSDGVKPVVNDVQMLRKGYLDVFGDLEERDKAIPETLDLLASKYAASPDKLLRRAREDYIEEILRASGPWKEAKDQTEVGRLSARGFESAWQAFWYDTVDAQRAMRELGYDVPKEQAVGMFRRLVPPDRSSRIGGVIPEDPRIGALAMGQEINRADWALAYSFAAARARQTEAKLGGKK